MNGDPPKAKAKGADVRNMKLLPILLVLFLAPAVLAAADCLPTGARVRVSGDDLTRVWVNGAFIGEKDYCDRSKGCKEDSLILPVPFELLSGGRLTLTFQTLNTNPTGIFSSWEFVLDCAGKPPFVVNVHDPSKEEVTLYFDPLGGTKCQAGTPPSQDAAGRNWTHPDYAPSPHPFKREGHIMTGNTWTAVRLTSEADGSRLPFLTHAPSGDGTRFDRGCGVLYWRQVADLPAFVPTATPTVPFSPTPTYSPTITFTPTITWTPRPTWTPWPTEALIPPRWTPTPRPLYVPPTPTPRRFYRASATPTPAPRRPRAVATIKPFVAWTPIPTRVTPRPTPGPAWAPPAPASQAVTFSTTTGNIFVTFADGAGDYQVNVLDAWGRNLKRVFEGKVVSKRDVWIHWDGTDAAGNRTPSGRYYVVIFKDGLALKSIPLVRVGE